MDSIYLACLQLVLNVPDLNTEIALNSLLLPFLQLTLFSLALTEFLECPLGIPKPGNIPRYAINGESEQLEEIYHSDGPDRLVPATAIMVVIVNT